MSSHSPALMVRERAGGVRLHLGSLAYGDGLVPAEAADDLVRRVLAIGRAFRASGFSVSPEFPYDLAALSLVSELDEIAAAGGDVADLRRIDPHRAAEQLAPPPAPVLDEDEQVTETSGSATRTISVPRRHRGSYGSA